MMKKQMERNQQDRDRYEANVQMQEDYNRQQMQQQGYKNVHIT